jgi:hypothetical protein
MENIILRQMSYINVNIYSCLLESKGLEAGGHQNISQKFLC